MFNNRKALSLQLGLLMAGVAACSNDGPTTGILNQESAEISNVQGPLPVFSLSLANGGKVAAGRDGYAAIFDGAAVVLDGFRTDGDWAPSQAWDRAKSLSGATRGIAYAKSRLGCAAVPLPKIGFRSQLRTSWYMTKESAAAADTLEVNLIPLTCGGAPRGASAAILVANIRNKPASTFARLTFRASRGSQTLEELMPDGTLARARLGDSFLHTTVEVANEIAPRIGRTATAILAATRNSPAIETWRALLADQQPSDIAKPMAPWFAFAYAAQARQDIPHYYYRFGANSDFKRSPNKSIFDKLWDKIDQTYDQLMDKLPDRASNYLLDLVFSK